MFFALIELHARNCKAFQKPFVSFRCCSSDAIIRAFATFTFLSSTAVTLSVSMLSLNFFYIKSSYIRFITYTTKHVLYIDPSVVYFSHEHILYLIIALVPCVFLVLIPALLLLVYPTRIYRSFSRLISTRKQLAITTFAEALHNCFKDGLDGTRDYRSLAGLIILGLPIGSLMSYIMWVIANPAGFTRHHVEGYMFFALSLVVAYVRPCKSTLANLSLSYHAFMFGILEFGILFWSDLSIGTEALELTFILIPLLSHTFAVSWAVYSISQYIRRNWTDLSSVLRCVYVRNRNGYQQLPDSASVGVEHNY